MGIFGIGKKKNQVAENQRKNDLQKENDYKNKVIADGKFISEFVDTLLHNCQTEKEMDLKIGIAMDSHPELFVKHHEMLKKIAVDNKLDRLEKVLTVAKTSDDETIKKLGNLKEAVTTSNQLEDKR